MAGQELGTAAVVVAGLGLDMAGGFGCSFDSSADLSRGAGSCRAARWNFVDWHSCLDTG